MLRLPMSEGWALLAWRAVNDPWTPREPVRGYIAQEIERRTKI